MVQENAQQWTMKDELVMSDIPWATAWYGQRQCVWLTANGLPEFYTINDLHKPIQQIYFSLVTLNAMSAAQLSKQAGGSTWDYFVLDVVARTHLEIGGVPKGFPLAHPHPGWPQQFILTFRQRPLSSSE